MAAPEILLPADAYPRIADRLDDVPHDLLPRLWTPQGITDTDGRAVPDARPEVGWTAIDLLFSGQFGAFVSDLLAPGSVRWVQGCLAGTDGPLFAPILEAGIRLSPSDAPNAGVAEYVMSTVLQTVHGGVDRALAQQQRRWAQSPWPEINGMTWVVVGFGSIGGEIAQRARPFGVEVVGVRRTRVDDHRADRMATLDDLHHELGSADVVVLACPLTEETRGLADAAFFDAMRSEAIVVNVSRGPVVDTDALLEALDRGNPSTAILDVFDVEPLAEDSALWDHPGVIITSHVAGAGRGIVPRGDALFLRQLDDYLAGRPLTLEVR